MKQTIIETNSSGYRNYIRLIQNITSIFFGIIEISLLIRLFMKMFAASTNVIFVEFIYNITNFFVNPFKGIIANLIISDKNPVIMLETATIFALIIVALVAWIIITILDSFDSDNHAEIIRKTETFE